MHETDAVLGGCFINPEGNLRVWSVEYFEKLPAG
jgi:hypothetical protein